MKRKKYDDTWDFMDMSDLGDTRKPTAEDIQHAQEIMSDYRQGQARRRLFIAVLLLLTAVGLAVGWFWLVG